MEKFGFIVKFYDKAYEKKSVEELVKSPVAAISGISATDADDLKKAFGIVTVEDLATNKYVTFAQGINCLAEWSGEIEDATFNAEAYRKLAKKPVSAITGVSERDVDLLKKAFGIDSIKELAENKYVLIAQTTVAMASMLQILKAAGVL